MAAVDNYAGSYANGRSHIAGPLTHFASVTPHDTNELAFVSRGVYVGGTGTLRFVDAEGNDTTLLALAAGIWHPIRCKIIKVSTTSATGIFIAE